MPVRTASQALPVHGDSQWQRRASHLLMLASGFAGLGYQIVWTQQCALWLGHESAAVLAVVAAFFAGLAFGSLLLGDRIERSQHPARWYAACEFVIASWSLMLALTMSPFSGWLIDIIGVQPTPFTQWTIAFFGTVLLLLPATAAMGATLPAMERLIAETSTARPRACARSIAKLYASNTFGAVIGVLAIAFWLMPQYGLVRTASVCIALNLVCSAAALTLFARNSPAIPQATVKDCPALRMALIRLAMTGLLGIGYEMLVVRVLSQVAEDTVYTFAMLLAVYLVGSAMGAAAYGRWLLPRGDKSQLGNQLICALALACLFGTGSLWAAEIIRDTVLSVLGASMHAALAAEATMALVAFGLPTFVMGALFSHLSSNVNAVGGSFGRALGINTLGAASAPIVFGVIAVPLLGPKFSLLLICIGYLALSNPSSWLTPFIMIPAGAMLAIAALAPPLAFIDVPEGGRIISYQEGMMAAVSVVEDADGVARLRINNRQQEGSSATLRVDARQALLPVLLHPSPKRVLFLGLGTGVTASAAAQDSSLQVDAVELLPEVITASQHFTRVFDDSSAQHALNTRLHLIAADARRYVKTSDRHYDVIISDNFHPARSGSGSLYTVEHFTAVRDRLGDDGIFCQWLPLHQMDLPTLRHIVQSFMRVYPQGLAMIASNSLETPVLGLIGRRDARLFDATVVQQGIAQSKLRDQLDAIGIEDEFALLGSFVAGPAALRRFAGAAITNTDDHPIVAYRAPRITYQPDSLPRERFFALLRELFIAPDDLVAAPSDGQWRQRLAAYWNARNQFIESGRNVRPSRDVHEMLSQVREPLLAVLQVSPDFRPAYDPLLMMAAQLAHIDAENARALLAELASVQPARPEAGKILHEIDAAR
jgi:spermidine synthase